MRILIVADVLGEENNGTTIATTNLIKYLKSKGEDVRVLCSDKSKINDPNYFVVPTLYLGFILNIILNKNNVSLSKPSKKIILKALEGVDIVHVMTPFSLAIKTMKLARKKGIPVTAGFHAQAENVTAHILHTMDVKWINDKVYKIFYKKLYKHVNAIHYPTQFIKDTFESVIHNKTNGYIISNGVNKHFINKEVVRSKELSNKFNILFIGRISKEKSHDLLIKAVSKSKYKDNIQLVFAGQGPKEKHVLKLSKKLKISKPIIKFYSRDELVNVINSCDLYVHPSEIEIEAISCLEAITCGLVPVISDSKRSATNAFAINENNLFKYNSIEDLTSKIEYWIEHEEERKKCSNDYLEYTEKFDQNICMEQMHNMLKTYAKEINHTNKITYYYRDEKNDDFENDGLEAIKIGDDYKYVHGNIFYRFFTFILYSVIVRPLIKPLNKLVYKQEVINHLTVDKKEIKGCFIYGNHTQDMGDAFTPNLLFKQKNYIIVGSAAVSNPFLRSIVTMLGGIPLPDTIRATKNFLNTVNDKINKGNTICIYPEAHIWPYYNKIRNYSSGSFRYPVELNKPIVVVTTTYEKYKNKFKMITHLDGPYYPNTNLDKKSQREELRNIAYNQMLLRSNSIDQYEGRRYINLNDIEVK